MMLHLFFGSRSLDKYLQTSMKNATGSGPKRITFAETCDMFSHASSLVRQNMQQTFETLFDFTITQASWCADFRKGWDFEVALSAFAALLERTDWDDADCKLLRRTARQLWQHCFHPKAPHQLQRCVFVSL